MKKAWPSDTWPATPVSRLMPRAPIPNMATWESSFIQSLSPRKSGYRGMPAAKGASTAGAKNMPRTTF